MSTSSAPRVIVVGAGIVGAACAEALAEDGCAVTVYDAGLAGSGTTATAMGHLVVMDGSEPEFALTAFSRRLWTERAGSLPPSCEDSLAGTLWLAANPDEMTRVREKARFYAEHGEAAEVLDAAELRRIEPQLSPGLLGALRVPGDRIIYPPAAVWALLDRARKKGAVVHEERPVEKVGPGRAQVGGSWEEADAVVVAAASESTRLLPGLPIEARKGHLVITDRHPGFLRHEVVELGYTKKAVTMSRESLAFNVQPRATGQLLIGSSRELVGEDRSINRGLRDRMLQRATEYLPGLSALRALRTWVGFRPATPDGLPLIGEWEPGLLVAAGHEGLGITTCLGTARIVADLVLGQAPPLDPSPFDPRRALHA